MTEIAVVVPWRAGDADREAAWAYTRGWWEALGYPVLEVEHPGPEPFNRSWCINEGARRSPGFDVLVAIDADVFAEDPQQVRDGIEAALSTGRLIVPHTVGADLTAGGTSRLLAGRGGWQRMTGARRDPCTSRITIIRRDLFELVGGFDERFRGWGHEDIAFWCAAVCARGVEQLPGTTYHLWHRPSLPAAKPTPHWRAGKRLADRYVTGFLNGWVATARLLDERGEACYRSGQTATERRRVAAPVDVICLTAGRKEYLDRTIASFEAQVSGTFGRRTIMDDSGNPAFNAWLRRRFRGWTIVRTPGLLGFTEAIRAAWAYEREQPDGSPYLFHLEEDFVFDRPVELADMITVLESDETYAQAALLRGPFFPPEIRKGGIVEEDPRAYEHRNGSGPAHLVHTKYFTTNPCVYRRELLEQGWPSQKDSEAVFTRLLVRKGMRFALMGDGEPWISHIGVERTGRGY